MLARARAYISEFIRTLLNTPAGARVHIDSLLPVSLPTHRDTHPPTCMHATTAFALSLIVTNAQLLRPTRPRRNHPPSPTVLPPCNESRRCEPEARPALDRGCVVHAIQQHHHAAVQHARTRRKGRKARSGWRCPAEAHRCTGRTDALPRPSVQFWCRLVKAVHSNPS